MIHLRGWFFQLPEPDNGFPHNNQKFLLIERDHTHEDARYDSYARYAGLIGYQITSTVTVGIALLNSPFTVSINKIPRIIVGVMLKPAMARSLGIEMFPEDIGGHE